MTGGEGLRWTKTDRYWWDSILTGGDAFGRKGTIRTGEDWRMWFGTDEGVSILVKTCLNGKKGCKQIGGEEIRHKPAEAEGFGKKLVRTGGDYQKM